MRVKMLPKTGCFSLPLRNLNIKYFKYQHMKEKLKCLIIGIHHNVLFTNLISYYMGTVRDRNSCGTAFSEIFQCRMFRLNPCNPDSVSLVVQKRALQVKTNKRLQADIKHLLHNLQLFILYVNDIFCTLVVPWN